MWGNGAVTLPKKWRDRFQTKNFLAEEDASGNLTIKPVDSIAYYENDDGSFGVRAPHGIPMETFLGMFKKAHATVTAEEKKKSSLRKRHASS